MVFRLHRNSIRMAKLRHLLIIVLAVTAQLTFAATSLDKLTEYTHFIQSQQTTPFDYLTQKVKQYNVVSLGEDHWVKDHMDFLSEYLRHIARDTTFHLDALAWESGNAIDQNIADTLMRSATFREDLALQILRDARHLRMALSRGGGSIESVVAV